MSPERSTLGAWLRGGGDRSVWDRAHYACCGRKREYCEAKAAHTRSPGDGGHNMGQFTERSREQVSTAGRGPAAADEAFSKKYPAVFEYLTEALWPDGKQRQTSTLLVLCEEGSWKACINDRALSRTGWCSAKTFLELLQTLEAGLSKGSLEFRTPKQPQRR